MNPNVPPSSDLFALPLGGVIEAALEAIVLVDEHQHIVALNPAALHLFGCSAADALGQPLARFIPARYRELHDALARGFAPEGDDRRRMRPHRQVRACAPGARSSRPRCGCPPSRWPAAPARGTT